jgi:hypothetical protein
VRWEDVRPCTRAAEGKDAEKEDAGPVLGVRGKVTRRGAGVMSFSEKP